MKFQGYKVLITGATSGIGRACAKQFLEEGATVIGIGRDFTKTEDLGERFIPCLCDVSDADQIRKACRFVEETFDGELDTFVNSAGVGVGATVESVTPEVFERAMNLLLRAPVIFGRILYPMLQKAPSKNGSIVNVASSAGRSIQPGNMMYNLTKNAHALYAKQQAKGFAGVRSNSVSPGFIDTPIFMRDPAAPRSDEQIQKMYEQVLPAIPIGRIGVPDDVASAVIFLASSDAMYITGADILIDGGLLTVAT